MACILTMIVLCGGVAWLMVLAIGVDPLTAYLATSPGGSDSVAIIAASIYGFSRVATGFLPIEDQGYLLASVQLPDGAALERTQKALDKVSEIARKTPGVRQAITIAGVSVLDNSAPLANAGVAYIMLKDWGERGKGEDLLSLYVGLNKSLDAIEDARITVLPFNR